MKNSKPTILILGASSFLSEHLIYQIKKTNKFKIICQSRKNLKKLFNLDDPEITFLKIDYSKEVFSIEPFLNCSYVINLINAVYLQKSELINLRKFLKHVFKVSKSSIVHISTASVYGACYDKIISENSICKPKNRYQKIKLEDEITLQNISTKFNCKCFILRPTEIFGNKSQNAGKFIKSYFYSNVLKKYLMKSFFKDRKMHFVSSKYLIKTILRILDGKVEPGIYLTSYEDNKINSYFDFCKLIDSRKKLNSKSEIFWSKLKILPLQWIFKIFSKIFRSNQIPPYSKFISNKPIIETSEYLSFEKDFKEHCEYILNN